MKIPPVPLILIPPASPYPRSMILPIVVLDGLILLNGLLIFASPFIRGYFPDAYASSVPGSQETTIHIALGAGISTLAFFRIMLAYGSAWVELLLFVLGLITLMMPKIMSMQWNDQYRTEHLIHGGMIMVLAVISAAITTLGMKKFSPPPSETPGT